MKLNRFNTLIYILPVLLLSCGKSFLEVVPQGNRIATTTNEYDLLMNNMNFFRDDAYQPCGWIEPQIMGDEAAASAAYQSGATAFASRLFRWEAEVFMPGDQAPAFLVTAVNNLYTFNKVIAEVLNATEGTAAENEILRGEAKASRAWTNFQLINYYAKPYNAATAGSDPGFPVITQPDATQQVYPRATVQGMYDQIISDLQDAIRVLPVTPRIRTRFSRPAAEGLLGKVYLFMGRPGDALPLLNAAFNDLSGGNVRLFDYNQMLGPVDPNYGPAGPGNDPNDYTEDIISKIFTNNPQAFGVLTNRGLLLTAGAAALYDSHDLRLKLYSNRTIEGGINSGGLLRKYGVRYSRYGLQLSELYLLRAECRARLNDLPGAVADLQELRKNRLPSGAYEIPAAIAGNQQALIHFVIDERTREFALEGYRWFDMRRLSQDPLFAGLKFKHTIYNTDGTTTIIEMDQPNRLVLRIPGQFMLSNPGMQNNP
jgi:hypothetical protein